MICYRDMTFCKYNDKCVHGDVCRRALTDTVKADAEKWWGQAGGAPIAVYTEKPDCYRDTPHEKTVVKE